MYYLYLLVDSEGKTYVGYTADLKKRIAAHNAGNNQSTRGSTWNLVYYEAYASKSDAARRERRLKQDGRSKQHLLKRVEGSIKSFIA